MMKLGDLMVPIFVAAMLGVGVMAIYKLGEREGSSAIQKKWDAEEDLKDAAINKLAGEYTVLQAQHKQKIKELSDELQASNAQHQATLAGYRLDYDSRLQLATNRADVYQRQARGSATEQERLARHAAELDRTLEEGRSLVRELGETLRQRDITIRALGGIIAADRTLLSENQ